LPLGPGTLAVLEPALGTLEPAGLPAAARLETFALVNGFVIAIVRTELAAALDPAQAAAQLAAAPDPAKVAAQVARLQDLLATGRYRGSPPPWRKAARSAPIWPARIRPPSSTGSWTGSLTA